MQTVLCLFNQQDYINRAEKEREIEKQNCAIISIAHEQSRLDWILDLGHTLIEGKNEKTEKTERHTTRRTKRSYRQCCRYITPSFLSVSSHRRVNMKQTLRFANTQESHRQEKRRWSRLISTDRIDLWREKRSDDNNCESLWSILCSHIDPVETLSKRWEHDRCLRNHLQWFRCVLNDIRLTSDW